MFAVTMQRANHVREYSIRLRGTAGWEVKLEEDRALKRQCLYHDWHRVERALATFQKEVADLSAAGWQIADAKGAKDGKPGVHRSGGA